MASLARRLLLCLMVCLVSWAGTTMAAGEDADLDRIPDSIKAPAQTAQPIGDPNRKLFIEDAATVYSWHTNLVVPPPPASQPAWQERLSFDARQDWAPAERLHLIFSGRFNAFGQDTIVFPSDQTVRLDAREAYGSWEALPQNYLDAGRINLKSGVAFGFNPTDFFKTRAVVDRTSQDPSVLRENRLGTLMVREQSLWAGGSITLAVAPQAFDKHAIYNPDKLPSLDPMFDRTNARQRWLAKTSLDLTPGFSPELLIYQENTRTTYGLNLSYGVGSKVVVYAEWAGGDRASLIEEAYRFGQETGTFPIFAPRVMPGGRDTRFMQDLAAGASYSTESKVTVYLEYDYHEAGLSRDDWTNWFTIGEANRSNPFVAGQLWYIRSYALDQQEPVARETGFLRASWSDAFVANLELTGLVAMNLYDQSSVLQATADYHASDRWSVGALAFATAGTARTERGSLSQESSVLLKATRYFY